jgi:hypothetical protein
VVGVALTMRHGSRSLGPASAVAWVALLVLALAPAAAAARRSVERHGSPPHAAATKRKPHKQRKAVKCTGTRVRVKLRGRLRCQALKVALPTPRRADLPLVIMQSALATDYTGARDRRHHRRPPSAAKLFRRVGPRAYRLMRRALPRASALLHRAGAARAGAHAANTGCVDSPTPPPGKDSGSFSDKSGDLSLNVKVTLDEIEATIESKHKRIDMRFDLCELQKSIPLPACPSSRGVLDARTNVDATITISLLEDGKTTESFTTHMGGSTELHGQVADDAQLDFVELRDTLEIKDSTPARGLLIGATRVSGFFKRHARVDMRSRPERYRPEDEGTILDASLGGIAGLLVGNQFRANATRRLKQTADKIFADTVARAIQAYRERETKWNEAGTCVDTRFDPASGTLRLRQGATGSFTARLVSKADGGTPAGDWRLTAPVDATFSPDAAKAEQPSFHYAVLAQGRGLKVGATLRATSKAGVGQGTWVQDTEEEQGHFYRVLAASYDDKSSGTVAGEPSSGGCGLVGIATSSDQHGRVQILAPPFDPETQLSQASDGTLLGTIAADGPGTLTGTVHGCDESSGFGRCTESFALDLAAYGPSFDVKLPPQGAAQLTWPLLPLSAPGGVGSCIVGSLIAFGAPLTATTTAPRSVFEDGKPHTLTVSATRGGSGGTGVQVSGLVTMSMTIQRVRENGAPL